MLTDGKTRISVTQCIAPAAITSTTNGTGVDLANCGTATAIVSAGTRTDGTHTPKLQESADNSSWSDVDSTDLVGSFVAITSNSVQKVGYIGIKRYVRVVSTVSGATTGAVYGANIETTGLRKQVGP